MILLLAFLRVLEKTEISIQAWMMLRVSVAMILIMLIVTASRGVAVLQRDIGIDSNQTGCINEVKYRRRQQVVE